MTIPNIITIGRLIIVPLLIVMIGQGRWMVAFLLFLAAGVSDAVDGFIARRFDMRSELGAYIDPLADKALLVSIYVSLAVADVLPAWLAIIVVSRDVMILGAFLVSSVMGRPVTIKPLLVSKLNTAAQIAFAALVLGVKAFELQLDRLVFAAILVVAALTIVSAAAYLGRWMRHMAA
jgi:cardiolipin synthase